MIIPVGSRNSWETVVMSSMVSEASGRDRANRSSLVATRVSRPGQPPRLCSIRAFLVPAGQAVGDMDQPLEPPRPLTALHFASRSCLLMETGRSQ